MIKHTALFAAMLVAGYVAPTHAETAQVEALAPQSWVVTGFVFKNDASENDIQTVESELNHQATVLNHLKGFKNYTDHALLYTRYQAAGYTFLVGPFPSDFSYIKSFQKQNASLGLIEPIKAGEEELDINVESILLSRSETQPGDAISTASGSTELLVLVTLRLCSTVAPILSILHLLIKMCW
ncbi:hypothetical protein N779_05290 [Vibrio coralliilyticus OCN008]|nr:hypothetical protein N779_05290 [Vibrio coralliilyticus OCN008]